MSINEINNLGVVCNTPEVIKRSAIDYFTSIFTNSSQHAVNAVPEPLIPNLVTSDMNSLLCTPPSLKEVKKVVFRVK